MTIAQSGHSDKFFPAEITAVSFDRAALLRYKLYENGFHPLPVSGKDPVARWPEKVDDEELIRLAETRTTNTGVDAKFTPAININIWDGPAAKAVEDLAREYFGKRGNIYVRFGAPSGGPPVSLTDGSSCCAPTSRSKNYIARSSRPTITSTQSKSPATATNTSSTAVLTASSPPRRTSATAGLAASWRPSSARTCPTSGAKTSGFSMQQQSC